MERLIEAVVALAMKLLLLALIRTYQLTLSAFVGRRCRYLPTCSDYASEAIRRHGAWHGFLLAVARISRCHPWGQSGFDPVPEVYDGPVSRMKKGGTEAP